MVYNDGRAAFRSSGADGIVTYDLDNLDGPAHWYQFAISWFRDEVPEGWGLTGTSVGTSMFINGKHVTGSDGNLSWVDPGTTFASAAGCSIAPGQVTIDDFRLYDVCLTTAEILVDGPAAGPSGRCQPRRRRG